MCFGAGKTFLPPKSFQTFFCITLPKCNQEYKIRHLCEPNSCNERHPKKFPHTSPTYLKKLFFRIWISQTLPFCCGSVNVKMLANGNVRLPEALRFNLTTQKNNRNRRERGRNTESSDFIEGNAYLHSWVLHVCRSLH